MPGWTGSWSDAEAPLLSRAPPEPRTTSPRRLGSGAAATPSLADSQPMALRDADPESLRPREPSRGKCMAFSG